MFKRRKVEKKVPLHKLTFDECKWVQKCCTRLERGMFSHVTDVVQHSRYIGAKNT